jgi:hypothetical protein
MREEILDGINSLLDSVEKGHLDRAMIDALGPKGIFINVARGWLATGAAPRHATASRAETTPRNTVMCG